MLLSQCRGLKRVLAVVNCHFLKVLLLTWHYQPPAYENETSTIFWFIFLQQPYFQGVVGSWENYLSRAVSMLVYIWRSFPLRADCPKLQLCRRHWRRNSNSWEVTASSLSFFSPPPERPEELARYIIRACSPYKLPEMALWKGSKQKKLVDEKGSVCSVRLSV